MTSLRQRMTEDMQVRNLALNTQTSYVQQVSLFARYFNRSPEELGPEEIRAYQVYLTNEKKLAPGSVLIAVAALRFLYKVSLKREWPFDEVIPAPKKPQKLPVVLSPEEVLEFLRCIGNTKHRTILTTCYAAGLRISEAVRLRPTDIDSKRMVIRVEQGILGYSLGGMVAQQVALARPSLVHKMLLVATAPEGGEDIMHMDKPELRKITEDPNMPGLEKLVKLFFAPSESSQTAGEVFAARLAERKQDGEPLAGQNVAIAQITAFRAWEQYSGERFAKLGKITQPCLVVNGVFDNMIPVRNSYMLSEHLPNAMLLTYPDAGHGSLFQFHKSFVRQASLFLDSEGIS